MKVFICSPYRGDVERNVRIACWMCWKVESEGNEPRAPHLYFTRFLDDAKAEERAQGIRHGLDWLAECSEIWVPKGIDPSEGMRAEIKWAKFWTIPLREIEIPEEVLK